MNKRLQQFISAEGISQSQFADNIGVTKASVSHILSGRNRPGFDFIESMATCYPNLNLDWLIGGKGRMYKEIGPVTSIQPQAAENPISSPTAQFSGQLFDSQEQDLLGNATEVTENKVNIEQVSPLAKNDIQPRITKILVFYDNGTFKEID